MPWKIMENYSIKCFIKMLRCVMMMETITESWTYYVYVLLTLVPVYLAFQLIKFFGWELFVNN
ncbi:uncharacterized protein [Eurosta solidaginis]|uniref:uncharacterized protein n=1 Tax=Eurosta solidaginis TaxID=178769 RepID=UPI00353134B3